MTLEKKSFENIVEEGKKDAIQHFLYPHSPTTPYFNSFLNNDKILDVTKSKAFADWHITCC